MNKRTLGISFLVLFIAAACLAAGSSGNRWYIGDGKPGTNKEILFRDGTATPPGIRYNDATGTLEVSDGGGAWAAPSDGAALDVVALTNDPISAGSNINGTAWTDNDDGFTPVVGQYIIGDADGTPALFEITVVVSPSDFDLAVASQPLANTTLTVQNYLPYPAGNEGPATVFTPASGPVVKLTPLSIFGTVNLAGSGPFTSGSCNFGRIERTVTMTCGFLSHSPGATSATSSNIVPAWAIPSSDVYNVSGLASTFVVRVGVTLSGAISIFYRDWAGGSVSRTSTGNPVTMSYLVD